MTRAVPIQPGVWAGWPWMRGIAYAVPGTWFVGPTGECLRVLHDGSAEEHGEIPRRWSVSTDPCATATRRAA